MAEERIGQNPGDTLTRSAEAVGTALGSATRVVADTASGAADAAVSTAQSIGGAAADAGKAVVAKTAAPRRAVRRTVRRMVKTAKKARTAARAGKAGGKSAKKKAPARRSGPLISQGGTGQEDRPSESRQAWHRPQTSEQEALKPRGRARTRRARLPSSFVLLTARGPHPHSLSLAGPAAPGFPPTFAPVSSEGCAP